MLEMNDIETAEKSVSVFDEISKLGHEQVVYCHDESTGLKVIIAIHNTILGPGLGGARLWNYKSEEEALIDVLRLSRGMTFKASITGLNSGGGKAVIIGDPNKIKSEALMRRFGKFIESLGGRYITAEDVNMKTRDMEYIAMETQYVTGLSEMRGGGGDPSPITAFGTYMGIKATCKKVYGSESLEGKKIVVQGVGQVGKNLVNYLIEENAKVSVSDISEEKLKELCKQYKVKVVSEKDLYDLDMDIYAPCALGATLNDDSIKRLKCQIVAGAANNQLKEEKSHSQMLTEEGIVYVPDFVINAGGLISVYLDYIGKHKKKIAYHLAENIYDTCLKILNKAEKENVTTHQAAMSLALKRIQEVGQVKLSH